MSLNMEEIERQLKLLNENTHSHDDHREDFRQLNKMHPADPNFRDKRLGKILDQYNEEVKK